ncbi:MAG: hypothetical protein L6R41_002980 [Letrouitia leprolyta]|nr:MAG: hypothetical protein L6R41_002980 [Letrouitia leprolyta]
MDGAHTSEATSIHDDESPVEENATRRHHLENLAIPSIQVGQHHASAASFNASLDQIVAQKANATVYTRHWISVIILLFIKRTATKAPLPSPTPKPTFLRLHTLSTQPPSKQIYPPHALSTEHLIHRLPNPEPTTPPHFTRPLLLHPYTLRRISRPPHPLLNAPVPTTTVIEDVSFTG